MSNQSSFHNANKENGHKKIRKRRYSFTSNDEDDSKLQTGNVSKKPYPFQPRSIYSAHHQKLPIFFGKKGLLDEIMRNPTVVLMSETGSGKTTQLPQYLLDTSLSKKGIICCTQPRRVAATTIAARVSHEKGVTLGGLVGYAVRFEDVTSVKTRLKYMTDGMLLREALLDPLLSKYSVVILDEAHERSVQTDVLFGVVKLAQTKRKDKVPLKIIIMSATLQPDLFVKYFDDAKICYLEGRRYPIKIMYSEEIQKDYSHSSLVTALQLHKEMPEGDILLFLTGQEEIESISRTVKEIIQYHQKEYNQLVVLPLFASLPNKEQNKVFNRISNGYRKLILATNIAETSVTIPGVKYVIDCGMVKAKDYNPSSGFEILKVQPISKAQARQRCGRAGRECAGICYRLYPEKVFHQLKDDTVPEIQRCNLKSVILQLLAMGVTDVLNFDFISPPDESLMQNAFKELLLLEAIETSENQSITAKGKLLSTFPLDPSLASCIIASQELGCTEEILSIAALVSVDSLIYIPSDQRNKVKNVTKKFVSLEGDFLSMLNLYRAFNKAGSNIEWCKQHYINIRNMKLAQKIRTQLREICTKLNITLKSCGQDYTSVRKALVAGLFNQSAERQLDGTYQTILHKQPVHIHPSSVLFKMKPAYVIFNQLIRTSKCYMRDLCIVDPIWLVNICPTHFESKMLKTQTVVS